MLICPTIIYQKLAYQKAGTFVGQNNLEE